MLRIIKDVIYGTEYGKLVVRISLIVYWTPFPFSIGYIQMCTCISLIKHPISARKYGVQGVTIDIRGH